MNVTDFSVQGHHGQVVVKAMVDGTQYAFHFDESTWDAIQGIHTLEVAIPKVPAPPLTGAEAKREAEVDARIAAKVEAAMKALAVQVSQKPAPSAPAARPASKSSPE